MPKGGRYFSLVFSLPVPWFIYMGTGDLYVLLREAVTTLLVLLIFMF